jgi:hypothetical protein
MTLPAIFPIASNKKTSILAEVMILVREHWGDEKLREYLEALENKDAVSGSVLGDKILAAALLKEKARKSGFKLVADAKEIEISRCMQKTLGKVELSHAQRRQALKLAQAAA